MCPLRPATDHCLGRLLPCQLANRPRAPLSAQLLAFPFQAYAVLAPVSQCYSPQRGRLPTCYSPVRHFTHGLLHFLVRLACVKRAASVDSEPGSNSRLNHLRHHSPLASSPVPRTRLAGSFLSLPVLDSKFRRLLLVRPTRFSKICTTRPAIAVTRKTG